MKSCKLVFVNILEIVYISNISKILINEMLIDSQKQLFTTYNQELK